MSAPWADGLVRGAGLGLFDRYGQTQIWRVSRNAGLPFQLSLAIARLFNGRLDRIRCLNYFTSCLGLFLPSFRIWCSARSTFLTVCPDQTRKGECPWSPKPIGRLFCCFGRQALVPLRNTVKSLSFLINFQVSIQMLAQAWDLLCLWSVFWGFYWEWWLVSWLRASGTAEH